MAMAVKPMYFTDIIQRLGRDGIKRKVSGE